MPTSLVLIIVTRLRMRVVTRRWLRTSKRYWRALGFPYPDALLAAGCDTFVVKASIEYHAPAHYDDALDVLVRVGRVGRTSMQFLIEVHRAAEHLISAEVIYVMADPHTRKPSPVPDFLREAISRHETVPPLAK